MIPGMKKAEIQDLPRVKERITFLYVEHCVISRADGAITVIEARGTAYVPAARLSVLMLGPGTRISHKAVELISNSGTALIWVGEQGVRYYAHGRPLTNSCNLLMKQATLFSNVRSRVEVARRMYAMRFPNEDVSKLTMQQLRGREGSRVRQTYRNCAKENGVKWDGRVYDVDDYFGSDKVNQALSAANACLYGIVHAAVVALGCSPGLGFVHTRNYRSFVLDIADLYKAETSIPISFEVAAGETEDVGSEVRKRMRDTFKKLALMERIVDDIHSILRVSPEETPEVSYLNLWDDNGMEVSAGVLYSS